MMFQKGDRVTWSSMAAGVMRTKVGSIIEVVPAGHRPKTKKKDNGLPRRHESYVVRAFTVRPGKEPQLRVYWPRVNALTRHSEVA